MSVETLLEELLEEETVESMFQKLLDAAAAVGLDVETYASGDPTRSELYAQATVNVTKEEIVTGAIRGGFSDTAEDDWLDIFNESTFDVPRRQATYGTCTVRYTNGSAQLQTIDPEGDTARISDRPEVTFRNTGATPTDETITSRTVAPGATLDLIFIADSPGTDSNATPGEIDELVSVRNGVTITNTTAAIGQDKEEDDPYRVRGKGKLSALSPNGPKGVYDYIATTPELNGGANVTRSRTIGNSTNGTSTTYLANDSGAVLTGDVDLCQEAFELLGEPIGFEATAANTSNLTQAVTYSLWVYDSINLTDEEIETRVATELAAAFRRVPIGGDIIPPATSGKLYVDVVKAAIMRAVHPHGFRVSIPTPAVDTDMTIDQVAVLGTVTATAINQVPAP